MPSIVEVGTVPTGTVMLFKSTSAPSGWTKVTSYNDVAIRLVSGSTGQNTANLSFSSVFSSTRNGTSSLFTLTSATIPSHDHGIRYDDNSGEGPFSGGDTGVDCHEGAPPTSTGRYYIDTIGTVVGGVDVTSGGHSHSASDDFNIKYIDYILASKG